jgi:hypothetical protein
VCDCLRVVWLTGPYVCGTRPALSLGHLTAVRHKSKNTMEMMLGIFLGDGAKSTHDGTVMLDD